jgi:hypothetical protein
MAQIRGNTQILDGSIDFEQLSTTNAYTTDLTVSAGSDELVRADAVKSYVDQLVDGSLKTPEAYDPTTTGNYPTTYGGQSIQAGDSFRITAAQSGIGGGSRDVNPEDLLIALVDNAGATTDADWMVAESNRDQATESTLGVAKIATQTITNAGTNDTDIVTPLKLKTYVDGSILAGAGMVKNGNNFDVVAADNSLTINADDMQVKIGNTNGTSLETTATGVELASAITGNRTFTSTNTEFVLGTNDITFKDNEVSQATSTAAIPFAVQATTNYGNGNGTAVGDVINQFRADFTDEAIINALVELKANIATSTAQARNGLTMNSSYVELGGDLIKSTTIDMKLYEFSVNGNNDTTGYTENVYFGNAAGTEISNFNIRANQDFNAHISRDFLVSSTNFNIGNTVNSYRIGQTPDGTVNLAIATVEYVNTKTSARKYNETTSISGQVVTLSTAPTNGFANVVVYLNGVRQILTTDYTITNTATGEVTFTSAQPVTTPGDVVIIDYTDA